MSFKTYSVTLTLMPASQEVGGKTVKGETSNCFKYEAKPREVDDGMGGTLIATPPITSFYLQKAKLKGAPPATITVTVEPGEAAVPAEEAAKQQRRGGVVKNKPGKPPAPQAADAAATTVPDTLMGVEVKKAA